MVPGIDNDVCGDGDISALFVFDIVAVELEGLSISIPVITGLAIYSPTGQAVAFINGNGVYAKSVLPVVPRIELSAILAVFNVGPDGPILVVDCPVDSQSLSVLINGLKCKRARISLAILIHQSRQIGEVEFVLVHRASAKPDLPADELHALCGRARNARIRSIYIRGGNAACPKDGSHAAVNEREIDGLAQLDGNDAIFNHNIAGSGKCVSLGNPARMQSRGVYGPSVRRDSHCVVFANLLASPLADELNGNNLVYALNIKVHKRELIFVKHPLSAIPENLIGGLGSILAGMVAVNSLILLKVRVNAYRDGQDKPVIFILGLANGQALGNQLIAFRVVLDIGSHALDLYGAFTVEHFNNFINRRSSGRALNGSVNVRFVRLPGLRRRIPGQGENFFFIRVDMVGGNLIVVRFENLIVVRRDCAGVDSLVHSHVRNEDVVLVQVEELLPVRGVHIALEIDVQVQILYIVAGGRDGVRVGLGLLCTVFIYLNVKYVVT